MKKVTLCQAVIPLGGNLSAGIKKDFSNNGR
jgi:hypothetical protein